MAVGGRRSECLLNVNVQGRKCPSTLNIYTVEMLDLMQSKMTSTTVGLLVVLILDIKDVGFPKQMKMNKRTQILYNRFQFPAMLYHAWKEEDSR